MKTYLNTILPRLKQFSLSLDTQANFLDHTWLRIDEPEHRVIFVFRSQGNELLISRDGDVSTHTWDYLSHQNSLLVEVDGNKTLYRQGFIDQSVMILQKDGVEEYVFMINESKVSASSVELVLKRLTEKYLEAPKPVSGRERELEYRRIQEVKVADPAVQDVFLPDGGEKEALYAVAILVIMVFIMVALAMI